MALGAVGLMTTASTASATTITETFAGAGPTGPLELQLPESINQPGSVTQGSNITISVPSGTQTVPATDSGVAVNYISGLHTIIPVPPQSTFFGNIVAGNWSFTDTSNVTTTGPLTVTECTTATTIPGVCDAVMTPSSTFLGPTSTTVATTLPYLEASTGSAQFTASGSLTLPAWSFDVTATGTGSIVSTVSEFDTAANITLAGTPVTVALQTYPAAPVAGCLSNPPSGCTQAPYAFQPIASTTINSPPAAPVLQPQTGNVSAGQCTTINPLTGSTDTGTGDSANPATVTVTTGPTNGTTSVNTTTGIITYCNTGGTALTDTFAVEAGDTLASPPLMSAPVTETINISYNSCSAGSTSIGSCSLSQAIILPVTSGQIVLTQSSGLPTDFLGSSFCSGGTVPGIVLNGQVQGACGVVSPLTITNATGLDTPWTLTGQVTDFNDPAAPGLTCDTVATYNNHCIPGGNLAWEPAAAVVSSIVPGDTAQVAPGGVILPFAPISPANVNPLLPGVSVQPNPVVEPAPNAGLQAAPATMCSTLSGQAGGTFVCGAGLELMIPASAAEPGLSAYGMPAYVATLTVTLS